MRTDPYPDGTYNETCRSMRRELTKSLINDREQWWIEKCREIEKLTAFGNSHNFYRLIWSSGPRNPSISEMIEKSDDALIHSEDHRLERWVEHFRE